MANIDFERMLEKFNIIDKKNTLLLVYVAQILYSALADANKIFKYLAKHMCDKDNFVKICQKEEVLNATDDQFLKNRE